MSPCAHERLRAIDPAREHSSSLVASLLKAEKSAVGVLSVKVEARSGKVGAFNLDSAVASRKGREGRQGKDNSIYSPLTYGVKQSESSFPSQPLSASRPLRPLRAATAACISEKNHLRPRPPVANYP